MAVAFISGLSGILWLCLPLRVSHWVALRRARLASKDSNFKVGRVRTYPIGAVVRVRLISGREIEGQVIKVETTALGTFMHVEFGEEVAHVTGKQVIGFYDFCFLKAWMVRRF